MTDADAEFDVELIPDLVEDDTCDITYHSVAKPITPAPSGAIIEEDKSKRVPVTILTGYLGSGKSTLLEQIALRGGRKLAVILNEFGDSIDIEKSLTIKDKDNNEVEEWLDLGNGCLCCTVKDSGVAAIERLVARRSGFDHIILETTGVADPGPITTMFWLDDGLLSNVYIDGVVTVLDAGNIEKSLDEVDGDMSVAHVQIALADVILLNKMDTIKDEKDTMRIKDRVNAINGNVPIYETQFGDISLDKILDLHAYEARNVNELVNVRGNRDAVHDSQMGTATFEFRKLVNDEELHLFETFLQRILWTDVVEGQKGSEDMEIHRVKGLVFVGKSYKVVQGVRATYELMDGVQPVQEVQLTRSRLVVIGRHMDRAGPLVRDAFAAVMGWTMD